jgi:hypothetical protein
MFKKVLLGLLLASLVSVSLFGCSALQNAAASYATGTISGIVYNSLGAVIASATVYTFNGTTVLSATTNSSGAFTLTGVWVGTHVLLITSSSYYAIATVAVTENTTTSATLTVSTGSTATAAPTVTLTSVGTTTASAYFTVAGTVIPTGEVTNVVISVNNNDTIAPVSSGAFSKVVNLVSGTNTIVVTAYNSAGSSTKSITVTYNPPSVQTGTVKITLNWDAADDVDLHLWNRTGDRHTYYGRHYGGPLAAVTVEVITVGGTPTTYTWTKDTTAYALPNTILDYDNIGGTRPENMTIFAEGLTQEARYLVGVNGYSGSNYPINCSISVVMPDGTTHAYSHTITSSDGNSGNPNTDTTHWWRPFDVVVSAARAVSLGTANTTEATSPMNRSVGSGPIVESKAK